MGFIRYWTEKKIAEVDNSIKYTELARKKVFSFFFPPHFLPKP